MQHQHEYGDLETARLTGTVHRKCMVSGCDVICALDDDDPQYIIVNQNEPDLYWNNDIGWGSRDTVDVFDHEERMEFDLPIEGEWRMI